MCDDYQPCAMLLHTSMQYPWCYLTHILSTPVHSFIIVQQHVWINHWDFSTQPFVACQVKGTNIATKSDRNFVSRFLSHCFVTLWDLWEQVDLLILFMKSEDARQRRSWRPRISWTWRKSSKFEFNLLSSILEAFKKWSDHYPVQSDQFHRETCQK